MQIKVTFETTEEMEQFCRMIAGEKEDRAKLPEGRKGAPVQESAPTAVPAGAAVPVTAPAIP